MKIMSDILSYILITGNVGKFGMSKGCKDGEFNAIFTFYLSACGKQAGFELSTLSFLLLTLSLYNPIIPVFSNPPSTEVFDGVK